MCTRILKLCGLKGETEGRATEDSKVPLSEAEKVLSLMGSERREGADGLVMMVSHSA